MNMFNSVPIRKPNLNAFKLTHSRKFSYEMGKLVPVMVKEILPGERVRGSMEIFGRMAPMLSPIMHDVDVFSYTFFVPSRLLWDEFEEFITGGEDGTSEPIKPFVTLNGSSQAFFQESSLADYLGYPIINGSVLDDPQDVDVMLFRAYTLIWNEYFRDQNVQPDLNISKAGGAVPGAEFDKISKLRNVAWGKEYFTAALPFAQRGVAASMPLEGVGSITYKPVTDIVHESGAQPAGDFELMSRDVVGGDGKLGNASDGKFRAENIDQVLLDSAGVTINDFRTAYALQVWLEANARGGSRYKEQLLSHWGVISSDARLQRPEYISGGKQPVVISEVLQSATDVGGEPLGAMGGHGITAGTNSFYKRSFEEHGFLISLMFVRPKTGYQQGLHRMFTRLNKFDYAWPELANLGEQEIYNHELLYNGDVQPEPAKGTFGYIPRYSEYKWIPNTVHGQFRSSLAHWHMNRIFTAQPQLNESFIECNPTTRIFAVPSETENMYFQVNNSIKALIPLPYYGVPSRI